MLNPLNERNRISQISVESSDSSTTAEFAKVPLIALRQKGRVILSQLLNPVKILPSEDGFPRDWRGIAHLAGLQSLYGPVITSHPDPMCKVIELWCSEGDNQTANFDNLLKFLGLIDRWDVADDILDCFLEDARFYQTKKHQHSMQLQQMQSIEIVIDNDAHTSDSNILTKDDVIRSKQGLPPQQYDAFVLFVDEDIDFAAELIEKLEEEVPKFGFKLCVKDRDLISGISFEHEAIMRLISDRCNRLIVIVSSAFLESPANTFFVNFGQALQIETRKRKIIPVLYEYCTLPLNLNFYSVLKYYRAGKLFNFWDRLADSVRSTTPVAGLALQTTRPPRLTITEINTTEQLSLAKTNDTVPIKIPRKKYSKNDKPQQEIPAICNTKINSSTSMMHLNVNDKNDLSIGVGCNTKAFGSLKNIPQPSKSQTNNGKIKWYKKFLKPSISQTALVDPINTKNAEQSDICCDIKSKPKKKSWYKRHLVTS